MINIKKIISIVMLLMLGFSVTGIAAFAATGSDAVKISETLLNQDPDPAEPGKYVELRFKIVKEGNDKIEGLKYQLKPEFPFYFDEADVPIKKIGDWSGSSEEDEYATLFYKLRVADEAVEGMYEVKLVQTSTSSSLVRESEFDIRVDEKKEAKVLVGKVETEPRKLIADYDEAGLKVEIVNNGDKAAEQVVAVLNLPKGFDESYGYSSRVNLGSIEAGSSKIATFYIDSMESLAKGSHSTSIDLVFKQEGDSVDDGVKEVSLPFDIVVFGRPQYEIVNQTIEPTALGSKGEIKLTLKNIGSRESDSTSVQVFKDSSQPFSFHEKSEFIGKINVDESGQVVFKYTVDADATPKNYKVKLQFRSVVDNDVLVEDKVVTLSIVKTKREAGSSSLGTIILVLVAFGAGFAVSKFRVSKKKKN